MQISLLDAVTVGAENAQYSVIWLHGLGADGHDFEPLVPELHFKHKSHTRFIFPHAPVRPVTLNMGYAMPSWFDIFAIDAKARQDEAGIRDAAASISALIERERQRGVSSEHIVLAGFSQGGALALYLGTRYPHPLGGILALSTYLPLDESLSNEASEENSAIPIFMAHGDFDPVVPLSLAQLSRERLEQAGYRIQWQTYAMGHSVIPAEIEDISRWYDSVLK